MFIVITVLLSWQTAPKKTIQPVVELFTLFYFCTMLKAVAMFNPVLNFNNNSSIFIVQLARDIRHSVFNSTTGCIYPKKHIVFMYLSKNAGRKNYKSVAAAYLFFNWDVSRCAICPFLYKKETLHQKSQNISIIGWIKKQLQYFYTTLFIGFVFNPWLNYHM